MPDKDTPKQEEPDLDIDTWQYLLVRESKGLLTKKESAQLAKQRAIYAKRQETNAG
jgi:hypothetical protein